MRPPVTKSQLLDPEFRSYAKCLAIGERPIDCECGECRGRALIMPALTNSAPHEGTLICPRCWHPLVGRTLWTVASQGGRSYIRAKKWQPVVSMLVDLGLLRKCRGHYYEITNAGLAVLWVKESVGWEFEAAHARGDYRSEKLTDDDWACGYWSHGDRGQWIHHHWRRATKVWPIKGVGVLRFGRAA